MVEGEAMSRKYIVDLEDPDFHPTVHTTDPLSREHDYDEGWFEGFLYAIHLIVHKGTRV